MNCVLFLGSARKGGNTEALLRQIIQGIEQYHGEYTFYRLPELDIHPCIGCGTCEKTGECIFKDDMQKIYKSIADADRIIIGSPIYFYNVTAQTKAFIDRCQTLWSRKYLLRQKIGNTVDRRGYFVSVAATRGDKVFEGAKLTVRYGFDAMDCTFTDSLLFRGMDERGSVASNPDLMQKAADFGINLIRS